MMTDFLATWKSAWRGLRRQPGFALLAVLTLAVGIGPTTAVYAVFRQVLLRELPVPNPQQLVLLQEHSAYETGSLHAHGGPEKDYFAYPAYLAFRGAEPALAAIAADPTTLVTKTIAERVNANLVTGNYFSVLGVRPVLGRVLTEDDNRIHAGHAVVVLSESYWRQAFGASTSVLGSVVQLNGTPFVVVGVAGHSSLMDERATQVFVPIAEHLALSVGRSDSLDDPLYRFVAIVGRRSAGMSREALEAKLNTVWWNWRRDVLHARAHEIGNARGWMQTHLSATNGSRGISELAEDFGAPVLALQAMTALVLLVACSNLASLLLARGTRRRGELAVRLALGSGRSKIVTATVAEAMLLGLGGAALGLPLGWLTLRLLSYAVATDSSIGVVLQTAWQWPVAGFALAAAVVTSVLFSAGPALAATRVRPAEVLRHGGGVAGSAGARMQRVLASGSIALGLVLLAGAVFLGWNLYRQSTVQFGFRTEHILSFSVNESSTGAKPARTDQVYSAILAGAQARPDVQEAAYAESGLLTGDDWTANITVEGRKNQRQDPDVQENYVTDTFFSLFDIPLVRGRDFSPADAPTGEQVAIVNQAYVRKFFNGNDTLAVGGHFGFGDNGSKMHFPFRIVGVVPSFYAQAPDAPIAPASAYMLYRQSYAANSSADASTSTNYPATFYLRTAGDPSLLAADMRALVRRVDPRLPIRDVLTMQQQVSEDIADIRLMALLSFGLGGLAVLLAVVGLYGVLAYQIATRTREIGVRIAVGASRTNVALLVFKSVCRLTVFGVGAGTLIAAGAAHLLHAQIAGLQQAPIWLYLMAGFLLFAAALLAAVIPAQRAARVEPMQALRTE
jgi:putative ABC transport system permease protein